MKPLSHTQLTHGAGGATPRRPHVVAIIPRGEAIRNFVYTGAFDEVARHADLTILTVVPNADVFDGLRGRYSRVLPLEFIPERWPVRITREILDMAHNRWLWSKAAQLRWVLRDTEASGATGLQVKRAIKKGACYPFANVAGLQVLSVAERAASRMWSTSDHYAQLFRSLSPSLVFNSSHVHSEIAIQAVQAAQWLGIPTATFVFSWDNLTSQGRIMPPYDHYLVWNNAIRQHLLQIYDNVRPEQVSVTGTPQFDFHFRSEFYWTRETFCARVGADPQRPIVLYSTGMPNHMPGEPEIVARIGAMLREMKEFGPPQLLVRVYPKDRTRRFDQIKRENPDILFPEVPWEPNWLTPRMEDAYMLTNTLRHAAVGINIGSTVTLELCMFDKPVINVAYNPPGIDISPLEFAKYYHFDHLRPVLDSGAVTLCHAEEEMPAMLRRALAAPQEGKAQRRALIKTMFGSTLDGYAGWRVAERLVELSLRQGQQATGAAIYPADPAVQRKAHTETA